MSKTPLASFAAQLMASLRGSLSPSPRAGWGPSLRAGLSYCVQTWWNKDRVRVSPREGRLLRVDAGAILFIERERHQVLGRDTIATKYGPVIRYRCEAAHAERELWVVASPIPTILLVEDHDERELTSDDVEVWG